MVTETIIQCFDTDQHCTALFLKKEMVSFAGWLAGWLENCWSPAKFSNKPAEKSQQSILVEVAAMMPNVEKCSALQSVCTATCVSG